MSLVRRSAARAGPRAGSAATGVRRSAGVLLAAVAAVAALAGCGDDGGAGASPSVIASGSRDTAPRLPTRASDDGSGDGSVQPTPAGQVAACAADQSAAPVDGGFPDVALDCLGDGPAVNLAKVRGRPLIVNVWAQWCEPCRAEAPYLAELARKAPGQGVLVYGVDFLDPRPELARAFAVEHGLAYPHLTDPDKEVGRPLELVGPPATVFVGADGLVKGVHRGPFTSYQQLSTLAREKLGVTL